MLLSHAYQRRDNRPGPGPDHGRIRLPPASRGDQRRNPEAKLAAGAYNTLSGPALCAAVTAHLQEVCPDKHLRLLWQDEPQSTDPADEDEGRAAFLAMLSAENQGIRRFEHLEGNIGHLDIRRIADAA